MSSPSGIPYDPPPVPVPPVPVPLPAALKKPLQTASGVTFVLGALVLVLVGGFVLIDLWGRDVAPYVTLISGPLIVSIVGALLARRQQLIADDLAQVKHQTNGVMAANFRAASAERSDIEARHEATAAALANQIDAIPMVFPHPAGEGQEKPS